MRKAFLPIAVGVFPLFAQTKPFIESETLFPRHNHFFDEIALLDPSLKKKSQAEFLDQIKERTTPVFIGLLLLGSENDVVQEGVDAFSGMRIKDVQIPNGLLALQTILEPIFLNQPLTDEKLEMIKRRLILYYREHGHPLMTVEVPFQDVTNGVVQLVLLESRLGKVKARGNQWFSSGLLTRYVRLKPGEKIQTQKLLEDVSWMNQNPFRHTDVIYTPGEEEGTTDIELVTKDHILWRLYGGGDNTGLSPTGHARWFGGFDWANVFGLDHILTFQGAFSTDLDRFKSVTFHYTAFLPWHNTLILYGGYAKVKPDIDIFTAKAHNTQVSLRYQIPIHAGYLNFVSDLVFGLDWKNCNNEVEFFGGNGPVVFTKPVNISQFVFGYAFGNETKKHKFAFNGLFFVSPGDILPHQTEEDFNSQREKAKNQYMYARATLQWNYRLPLDFLLDTQLRLQGATENLLASEQFGLGGYDTIRGYKEREYNADNALCLNFELRSKSFSLFRLCGYKRGIDRLTFLAFVDYGLGGNHRLLKGEPRSHYLISIGPGARYMISNNFSARFDWGFKLHQLRTFNTHGKGMGHMGVVLSY